MTSKGRDRFHDGAANTAMQGPASKRSLKRASNNGASPFVWGAMAVAVIVAGFGIIGGLGYAYVSYSQRNDVPHNVRGDACTIRLSGVTISADGLTILDHQYESYEILVSTKRHSTTLTTRKTIVDSTGPHNVLETFDYDTPFPDGCEIKVRGIPA